MEIKNSNAVLRLHCNDSDGFTWIKSLNALCKILPGRIFAVEYYPSDYNRTVGLVVYTRDNKEA